MLPGDLAGSLNSRKTRARKSALMPASVQEPPPVRQEHSPPGVAPAIVFAARETGLNLDQ